MKHLFYFQQIIIILIIAFASLSLANSVEACTCISPWLEEAIKESPNVVILKLQLVEKHREGESEYGVDGIKQSRLSVEKVFKGNLKTGQEIIFSQGGGADCVWTFGEEEIGTEYLFFLGSKPIKNNLWEGYICSRSNTLKGAAEDLQYLENLSNVRGKTRLSGTIAQENKPAVEGEKGSYNRLVGETVIIKGNGKNIKLKTNENGVYEIYDLPVGKYTITPEKISGYKLDDKGSNSIEVEIEAKSLTEQDFEFTIDNSISGKLFDTNGKPLEKVCLDLQPTRGKKAPYFYQGDCTDTTGAFNFDEIPLGTYVIVVNEDNEISARQPFGTFYYPNKTNLEEAAQITIGAGDHFENLVITAPTTAETITINGILLFDDGKPVSGARIEFFNNIEDISKIERFKRPDSQAETEENGQFSIRILKGQKGILFGQITSYVYKYEKCPEITTQIIQIKADNNLTEVKLKFPFPRCEKQKSKGN